MSIGSTIGTVISQPLDVLKTRYACGIPSKEICWIGCIPRVAMTTVGLTVGQLTLSLLTKYT